MLPTFVFTETGQTEDSSIIHGLPNKSFVKDDGDLSILINRHL
jgi:hypothetical protein